MRDNEKKTWTQIALEKNMDEVSVRTTLKDLIHVLPIVINPTKALEDVLVHEVKDEHPIHSV